MPELSVLCDYIEKFTTEFKTPEGAEAKYYKLNFNHCVIVLLEIVQLNDTSDVIGCERLKLLLKKILIGHDVSEHVIKEIAHVVEQVIPTVEARLEYFNGIVVEMVKPGGPSEYSRQTIIEDLINRADMDTKVEANSLKMEMMELKEQEAMFVEKKQYANAQQVTERFASRNEALIELLRPFAEDSTSASQTLSSLESLSSVVVAKKITPADIIKNLRICFYTIMMKGVKKMTHECMNIYNDFIRYHLESSDCSTRVWALKTATAYSMLYESLAKEVFLVLKSQMFKSDNVMIWQHTIGCIIDLLLRYGIDKMEHRNDGNNSQEMNGTGGVQGRSKKGGRMLYTDDGEDAEEMDIVGSIETTQVRRKLTRF
jgi:Nuclear condensing complex subunits, C-term domain